MKLIRKTLLIYFYAADIFVKLWETCIIQFLLFYLGIYNMKNKWLLHGAVFLQNQGLCTASPKKLWCRSELCFPEMLPHLTLFRVVHFITL